MGSGDVSHLGAQSQVTNQGGTEVANQFRTTISLVYWNETPQESAAISSEIMGALPDQQAQDSMLITIEYKPEGEPDINTQQPLAPVSGADPDQTGQSATVPTGDPATDVTLNPGGSTAPSEGSTTS